MTTGYEFCVHGKNNANALKAIIIIIITIITIRSTIFSFSFFSCYYSSEVTCTLTFRTQKLQCMNHNFTHNLSPFSEQTFGDEDGRSD